MVYLITFACYGCHLHGDLEGSVNRTHRVYGGPLVPAKPGLAEAERQSMDQSAYAMDASRREIVLRSLQERCAGREWHLLAAHVRSNHVHVLIEAEVKPERMMNDLKSYASRCLNAAGVDEPGRKRWARHGSTRWLWDRDGVRAAIRYVADGQGTRWRCTWRTFDRSLWSRLSLARGVNVLESHE